MGALPLVVCGLLHRNSATGQIARLWVCAWLCAMFYQTPSGTTQAYPLHSGFNTFPCHPVGCHSFFLLESSKSCSSTSDRDFSLVNRTRKERRAHFHSRNSTEQVAIHCCFYLFGMLDSFMGYSHNETFFISITHAKKYRTVVHVFSLRFKHCQSTHICRNEFYILSYIVSYFLGRCLCAHAHSDKMNNKNMNLAQWHLSNKVCYRQLVRQLKHLTMKLFYLIIEIHM